MRAALITIAMLGAAIAVTCTTRGDTLLAVDETVCITAGVPDPAPVYRRVNPDGGPPSLIVQRILNQSCRTCHGDVRRYGAPASFDLGCYDTASCSDGGTVRGAADMAFGICVSAVQALPDSPLRMPFHPLRAPLCDSDRETLRRWINAGAPRETFRPPNPSLPEACRKREDLGCITTLDGGAVPARPEFAAHVAPILDARCTTCHSQRSYFEEAAPQRFLRLFTETSEDDGSERGVGAFEYRGEIARSAAERVPRGPFHFLDPMPYDPPYGGTKVPLVAPLCDADRAVLDRWAAQGRRTGTGVDLPRECVTATVPERPTWNRDVGRILTARCGLCHGERDRTGQRLRLDLYENRGAIEGLPGSGPGVTDAVVGCRKVLDGVTQSEVTRPIETGDCVGGGSGRQLQTRQLIDLVELVAMTSTAYMPYGSAVHVEDGGTFRAPLCDTDQQTIRRWRANGMPLD